MPETPIVSRKLRSKSTLWARPTSLSAFPATTTRIPSAAKSSAWPRPGSTNTIPPSAGSLSIPTAAPPTGLPRRSSRSPQTPITPWSSCPIRSTRCINSQPATTAFPEKAAPSARFSRSPATSARACSSSSTRTCAVSRRSGCARSPIPSSKKAMALLRPTIPAISSTAPLPTASSIP